MIFYLLGKSGSGKDTILKELLRDEELSLQPLILYTTRPIRPGEVDGREYHFITESQVDELQKSDRFIELREYNTVQGVWKYMSYDNIKPLNTDDKNYITIGTLPSYMDYVRYYGQENVTPIYIVSDMDIRKERSYNRLITDKKSDDSGIVENDVSTEDIEEISRRLNADEKDFSDDNLKKCDINKHFDNSGELENCVNEIKAYIKAIYNRLI